MSKELTEKYYDCLLEDGFYYAKSNDDNNTFIVEEYPWDDKKYHNCEILAPVPSYEKLQKLKAQLQEANEVVKKYMSVAFGIRSEEENPTVLQLGFGYLKKWGVK